MNDSFLYKTTVNKYLIYFLVSAFILSCNKNNSGNPDIQPSPYSLAPKPIAISAHIKGYYEYLPEGYLTDPGSTKYALLIFFHGANEIGSDSTALGKLLINGPLKQVNNGNFPTSFTVNNKAFKFIIIAPQFTTSDAPYPEEVEQVIDYANQKYRVDASRVFLTGLSFGAGVCWNFVGKNSNYAKKIAAIVPIAAYISELKNDFKIDVSKSRIIAASNLPIWSTHNRNDNECPLSWVLNADSLVKSFRPAPKPLPKLTVFEQWGHEGWTTTYDPQFKENNLNIYEWMLQYHR